MYALLKPNDWLVISALLFSSVCLSLAAEAADSATPYTVKCAAGGSPCKVDAATYKGWRTYHAVCHTCHAQDAVGSTFAPSLLERLQGMDKEKFMDVVLNGMTGQVGVMPGWKQDPNVLPRVDDLWSFLKARSDAALAPGKPGKLP